MGVSSSSTMTLIDAAPSTSARGPELAPPSGCRERVAEEQLGGVAELLRARR